MKNKTDREKLEKLPSATKNKAGGLAFNFEDPAEYFRALEHPNYEG